MVDELSLMVKDMLNGTKDEIKELLPSFDLKPDISDSKIKQAILDLTPDGMQKMFQQYGQTEVLDFISKFSQGRKW